MAKTAAKTTYLLKLKDGSQQKLTMDSKWKLTFGMIAPGKPGSSFNNSEKMCLRVYDGTLLRAVFTEVDSFRTLDISVIEKVKETKQETVFKETPEGKKAFVVEANVYEWRDPDQIVAPRQEFKELPRVVTTKEEFEL